MVRIRAPYERRETESKEASKEVREVDEFESFTLDVTWIVLSKQNKKKRELGQFQSLKFLIAVYHCKQAKTAGHLVNSELKLG